MFMLAHFEARLYFSCSEFTNTFGGKYIPTIYFAVNGTNLTHYNSKTKTFFVDNSC